MFKTNYATNMVLTSDQKGNKLAHMLDSSWSQSRSFRGAIAVKSTGELLLENAVEAMKTKRLSFEPGCGTNSILGGGGGGEGYDQFPFQDCVVQAVDATNPYIEFRVSMEEMVESYYGVKKKKNNNNYGEKDCYYNYYNCDWEYLEGLLSWYLRMNDKKNYGVIVEAFIDMYAGLVASCPVAPNTTTTTSSCSFSYNASASSSKSKDWWEININEASFIKRAEKELCPNYN
ncbi:hypothetical protein CsatB_028351 [Cannabis sativa]